MSDIDLQYELMLEGRLNLMHLPPGAIAWLWDRPKKQVDAAEELAVSANAHGNPVVDASLLKADQNILLIKCEGGECFRIYPDGGFSYEDTPMDIGGCSSILRGDGGGDCGCPMDDMGHAMDPSPGDGYNDAMDVAEPDPLMADIGNDEHMDTLQPEAGIPSPEFVTNLAGEPTMEDCACEEEGDYYEDELARKMYPHARFYRDLTPDEKQNLDDAMERGDFDEDIGGDWGGPGTSDGMGTGNPFIMMISDEDLEQMMGGTFGDFEDECRKGEYDDEELDDLARTMDTHEGY